MSDPTLHDLIDQLETLASEYGDDTPVRLAFQREYPFEYSIGRIEAANLSEETCEVCNGSGCEDTEVQCGNCDGTGVYREDDKTEDEIVIYIGEDQQLRYLPTAAAEALEWR